MTPDHMETILREMPEVEFLVEYKWPLPLHNISVCVLLAAIPMCNGMQVAQHSEAFSWVLPLAAFMYAAMMVLLALSFYHTLRQPRFDVYLTKDAFAQGATDELRRKFRVKQIRKGENGYRVWPYRGSNWHTYYG